MVATQEKSRYRRGLEAPDIAPVITHSFLSLDAHWDITEKLQSSVM